MRLTRRESGHLDAKPVGDSCEDSPVHLAAFYGRTQVLGAPELRPSSAGREVRHHVPITGLVLRW